MNEIAAVGHGISEWAVNFIATHPSLIGWALVVFVVATFTCNAIKWAWPVYHEMPRAARFVLGFCMPLALNFWSLSKKVGIQEPIAPTDDTAKEAVKP